MICSRQKQAWNNESVQAQLRVNIYFPDSGLFEDRRNLRNMTGGSNSLSKAVLSYIFNEQQKERWTVIFHELICIHMDYTGISDAVLAEISPRSPQKILIFIIKKYIYRISVSKNKII